MRTVFSKPERRIVCAAVLHASGVMLVGVRHFCPIMQKQIEPLALEWHDAEQGFIDQFGEFHNRTDAYKIANTARQIIRKVGSHSEELYSENLY